MSNIQIERVGFIASIAEKLHGSLGRTGLMKYFYFLQTLRGVPLGYSFSLYSYGPFDSAVLADLNDSESLGVVDEQLVFNPVGYGYRIKSVLPPGESAKLGGTLLDQHRDDVDWVIQEFGSFTAAQLELASTIVYTDREAVRMNEMLEPRALARRVKDVKPRFDEQQIVNVVESLKGKGLLQAVA